MKLLITSDLHGKLPNPPEHNSDYLVICGDICPNQRWQSQDEWLYQSKWIKEYFIQWLNNIQVKEKFLLFGNHDMVLPHNIDWSSAINTKFIHDQVFTLGDEVIYANGSSWNAFQLRNWGFGYDHAAIHPYVDKIPMNTTILFTHEPAYGVADQVSDCELIGSIPLLEKIKELPNLKMHALGHCHEGRGIHRYNNGIVVINAACGWFEYDSVTGEVKEL